MPRKPKLGQNFLADRGAAVNIANALGDISRSTVIEIGPGGGAITSLLAARAARLIAVELDATLATDLRERFALRSNVEILQQDILKTDFSALVPPGQTVSVVGNLPYYITSDILLHLFAQHRGISLAVLMTQREVADRIAAIPGTRDYGMLSSTTQMYARVDKLFTLPPEAFSPPPDVYSTVLRLRMQPRFAELDVEPQPFIQFLKQIFAQKRKTLGNNLRAAGYPPQRIAASFENLQIHSQIRAEALPLESAAALFRQLTP